jgi:sec-independent protein translocase protein TatA
MHMMGPLPLLLIAIVVLVLFGRGKVSSLMGEVGKGITAFKRGISEGSKEAEAEAKDVTPIEVVTPVTPAPKAPDDKGSV